MERRGTRSGHQYNLLGYLAANDSGVIAEPYMITLTNESDEFQHEGVEYLYFLEGSIEYRHGDKTFLMEPGDSLFLMRIRRMDRRSWLRCRLSICQLFLIRRLRCEGSKHIYGLFHG